MAIARSIKSAAAELRRRAVLAFGLDRKPKYLSRDEFAKARRELNRPRRDTYHDYITLKELTDIPPREVIDYRKRKIDDLCRRSGAAQVKNATVWQYTDMREDATRMEVTFDSTAWTGLPGPQIEQVVF